MCIIINIISNIIMCNVCVCNIINVLLILMCISNIINNNVKY